MLSRDRDGTFPTVLDAAAHDQRIAYVTDDPLDLYHWICTSRHVAGTHAEAAFLRDAGVRMVIKAMATEIADPQDPEDTAFTAFDGNFLWRPADREWTLGNDEPESASDLVEALCEASLRQVQAKLEQTDA